MAQTSTEVKPPAKERMTNWKNDFIKNQLLSTNAYLVYDIN